MIRKAALQIGAPALLAFMAVSAYLAVNHFRQMQKVAAATLESSRLQDEISSVLRNLTAMETGQRGYLLTGDADYLQPYTEAKAKLGGDLSALRARLANRTEHERSLESQLEPLTSAKQAEMERSIDLRQKGYRHRAFMMVNTNEGKEYMDRARELLTSLSQAESDNFAKFDRERNAALNQSLKQTVVANFCMFVLAASLFVLVRYHGQVLEQEASRNREELDRRDLQLEKLMSALGNQARSKTSAIESNARLLLQNYGGFLPRQGHEYAELIQEASSQMERLRQDLVGAPSCNGDERAA